MYKDILKEELGISNEVNELTIRVKNLISSDFAKNKDNNLFYKRIKGFEVFSNKIDISFNNIVLKITYVILISNNTNEINSFKKSFDSEIALDNKTLFLYLTTTNIGKINWKIHSMTVQHEIEHFFQTYKRGESLLNKSEMEKYKQYISLIKSDNIYDKVIGYIFYFYVNAERDALVNGLYRKIMELNDEWRIYEPSEVLKEYGPYKTLSSIRYLMSNWDSEDINKMEQRLQNINKTYSSFSKIVEKVYSNYIRGFAKVLCKANKDLTEKFGDFLL